MSEEPTKKGIMLAYANGLKFEDLAKNDKINKFLDILGSQDKAPDSPGFKVVDFGVQDNLETGEIQITGGEDVKAALSQAATFVRDGVCGRYVYTL